MLAVLRYAIFAVVVILAYSAYRKYVYEPGQLTRENLVGVISFADRVNAGDADELKKRVEEAVSRGDIAQVRRLLRPAAERAGQLADLERELKNLAQGTTPVPEPPKDDTVITNATVEQPEDQLTVEPVRQHQDIQVKLEEPPAPLPDPSWDLSEQIDPERWYKAVPRWADNLRRGINSWIMYGNGGGEFRRYGTVDGVPPYQAFVSADADEREFARMILTYTIQTDYRLRFGPWDSPLPGSPTIQEFGKEFIKGEFRTRAPAVLGSH